GALPRYFVYGGLVLTPLSFDYLRRRGGNAGDPGNREMYYELYYRPNESPATARREPIILASVLADAVNANFAVRGHSLVDRINGVRIANLEDAIRALDKNTNAFDVIEFLPKQSFECLSREEVTKANSSILKTYGITKDRRL